MTDAFDTVTKQEKEFDQYGRYLLPDPGNPGGGRIPWTRATTLARTIDDTWNLQQWDQRMVAHGLGKREDLFALVQSLDPETNKKELQQVCDDAKAAAGSHVGANLGTAFHGFTVVADRNPGDWEGLVPARWHEHVRAYREGLRAAGFAIVPNMLERKVVNTACKSAGTFDRMLIETTAKDRVGVLPVIGDVKSEKESDNYAPFTYSMRSIAMQLAIYAYSSHYWTGTDYIPLPPMNLDTAYVMYVPARSAASFSLWEVDIKQGWGVVELAIDVRRWRNTKGLMKPIRVSTSATFAPSSANEPAPLPVPDAANPGPPVSLAAQYEKGVEILAELNEPAAPAEPAPTAPAPTPSLAEQFDRAAQPILDKLVADAPAATAPFDAAQITLAVPEPAVPPGTDWPARARAVASKADASALWTEATAAGVWSTELEQLAKTALQSA